LLFSQAHKLGALPWNERLKRTEFMKHLFRCFALIALGVVGSISFATAGETVRIGLSQPNLGWPYIAAYTRAFEKAAARHADIKVVVLSAQGDIAKQASDMETLIAKNVDIILVCSLDGNAIVPSLLEASNAGIPVLAVSNEPSEMGKKIVKAYSGPDDYIQGTLAAELMHTALSGSGNVVIIEGTPGQSTTEARNRGFRDGLEKLGSKIEVLGNQTANWNPVRAKTVAENFLTVFGDKINGLFSHDDNTAAAAAEVIRAAGRLGKIQVVSTGGSINGIQAIKSGAIYGTVNQSPSADAEQGLALALRILKNQPLAQKRNIISMPKITAENVHQFKGEW
jgi:ribose transport system substrate-binding protein